MDNPDFYDQIMNIIEDFGNERYLLCGDFNLVLCPHIDCYNYLHVNNPNARDKLIEIGKYRSFPKSSMIFII
jgi:hypothetical protein